MMPTSQMLHRFSGTGLRRVTEDEVKFRSKPQELQLVASARIGSVYVYAAPHPIERMLQPDYWLGGAHARLRPADTIMIREVNTTATELVAWTDAMVASVSKDGVKLVVESVQKLLGVDVDGGREAPAEPGEMTEVDPTTLQPAGRHRIWNSKTRYHELWDGPKLVAVTKDKDGGDAWVGDGDLRTDAEMVGREE